MNQPDAITVNNMPFNESQFDIFVPAGEDACGIDPGSAIVGGQSRPGQEQVLVYFESNRFGAENIRTFEDRCLHAADRAATGYPTIAKALLPASSLLRVGTYDLAARKVTSIEAPEQLRAWLGSLPMPELV